MRTAVIIGAGPAGLTAAYELLARTDIVPIVLEQDDIIGGIARTVDFKGNRMDIGPHRFFTKSDRVMDWWLDFFPVEPGDCEKRPGVDNPEKKDTLRDPDRVMLMKDRKTRILFSGKLFDYPVSLSVQTLMQLGIFKSFHILFSYLRRAMFPIKPEKNLEDFFINSFGRELYITFFKSYTEKVWGIPCSEIDPSWGAQRTKGLSVWGAIVHMVKSLFPKRGDIRQKDTETSLIEHFLYPKRGPGQLWDAVREEIESKGGKVITGRKVRRICVEGNKVRAVETGPDAGDRFEADFIISSMPISDLVASLENNVPEDVAEVAGGLQYRDLISAGVILKDIKVSGDSRDTGKPDDNWIYIQEPGVLIGRMDFFNNFSKCMVKDPEKVWMGMEYFCFESDELWQMKDEDVLDFAIDELVKLNMATKADFIDGTVQRMPKAYPAYFGAYGRFPVVRDYLDGFENLFLIGRNGMHKYNNMDHSMLTAMIAVDGLESGTMDKSAVWAVNTEEEYHEEKQ